MARYKIVHYINQFFVGIGDEEKADYTPEFREGVVEPGMGFKATLREGYEIVSTTICGDNYFGENLDAAAGTIIKMVKKCKPNVSAADPAFNTRYYSVVCGTIYKAVEERLDIPVITGMYIESPGVDISRKDLIIMGTPNSTVGMPEVLPAMFALIKKMTAGEEILRPREGGYIERGIRVSYFTGKRGSERVLEMLVKRLKGEEYGTDLPIPKFDRVVPAEPVKDVRHTKIAMVISGGIVPTDNPDYIGSSNATKWDKYDITGMNRLPADGFTAIHGGYDRQSAMANPNVVVPSDALKELERAGEFGGLANYPCATTGTKTATAPAARFGSEVGQMSIGEYVDAITLASTWGACTRHGAMMVKGIEKHGTPVVHVVTVVSILLIVGANRIIPGMGISYPLGDLPRGEKDSYKLRLSMVRRALKALQTPVDGQTVFEK